MERQVSNRKKAGEEWNYLTRAELVTTGGLSEAQADKLVAKRTNAGQPGA